MAARKTVQATGIATKVEGNAPDASYGIFIKFAGKERLTHAKVVCSSKEQADYFRGRTLHVLVTEVDHRIVLEEEEPGFSLVHTEVIGGAYVKGSTKELLGLPEDTPVHHYHTEDGIITPEVKPLFPEPKNAAADEVDFD